MELTRWQLHSTDALPQAAGKQSACWWAVCTTRASCPVGRMASEEAACCLAVCLGKGQLLAAVIDMLSEAQLTRAKIALAQLPLDCLHWVMSIADGRH